MITRLTNTFLHIPRIGKKTEKKIWCSDILNWYEFLDNGPILTGSIQKRAEHFVEKSVEAFEKDDHTFFRTLPDSEKWRVYREFSDRCAFVDIETTGLSKYYNKITTIGIYNGKESKVFIRGKNLEEFKKELDKYKLLVTFNGKCFDIPFIEYHYPETHFDQFHIDLRYTMARLGYTGGLKQIESELGIDRKDLKDIDGREAVRLWHMYERGNKKALDLLIRYNIADIENLKNLMEYAYEKLREKRFLSVLKPTHF